MIALLQRVSKARVIVDSEVVGEIGRGLMVLLCAERGDTEREADQLLERLVNYRIFNDDQGKMNLSLIHVGGELLVVPQFTLAANTNSGTRPSFSSAASFEVGERLYDYFCLQAQARLGQVGRGRFAAHMEVELTNDGPVTIWLSVPPVAS